MPFRIQRHTGSFSRDHGGRGMEEVGDHAIAELRHRLWLQTCLGHLGGLGQEEELTLRKPEQHYRIEEFITCLREHKESVKALDLTLEKVMTVLILPPQDEPIFVEMMREQLGLASTRDSLAEYL